MKQCSLSTYYIVLSLYVHMPLLWGHERLTDTPTDITMNPQQAITLPKKQKVPYTIRPPRINWFQKSTYNPHTMPVSRLLPERFTTSIIIPCYYKHASLLYNLIHEYTVQTVLPDEIVIALSEYNRVPHDIMTKLQEAIWPFPVTLLLTARQQFAGENRNTACNHAISDVFICQDADDTPHPQRIEIIRYFFDHYPVEHLLHKWVNVPRQGDAVFPLYADIDRIPSSYHSSFRDLWNSAQFTNGNIALARHVFHTTRWTSAARAQDSLFNEHVYKKYKHCIAIDAALLGYRQFLSSIRQQTKILDAPTYPKHSMTHLQNHTTTCICLD